MEDENKDVQEDSSASTKSNEGVETTEDKGDDKSKNFAELRKKAEEVEKENAELRKQLANKEESDRSLLGKEPEEEKKSEDVLKTVFERDVKDVTREWNKKTQVSTEEWSQIKKKVSLTGEETRSEITDKIQEAYDNLPATRERREKELVDKGRKEAMRQFNDDELDIGSGGEGADFSSGAEPRFSSGEKKFLDNFGVKSEDRKKIDKNADSKSWKVGTDRTRKFFAPNS